MAETCIRCHQPGAGSVYTRPGGRAGVYHMTCKLEQKQDDGLLPKVEAPKAPKGDVYARKTKRAQTAAIRRQKTTQRRAR